MTGVLEASGIEVTFGSFKALDGVTVAVPAGHITGLIGPNGAGKTTLFNAFTGLVKVRSGRITLDGQDLTDRAPHHRAHAGIARTYQRLELFGSLSVRDNVLVAAELQHRRFAGRAEIRSIVDQVLADLGLEAVSARQADTLSTGNARRLEVARAIASRARFLLLDEPSAGLDAVETASFRDALGRVADAGVGILLVEHDVGLVMSLSTHVYVLDFGRMLAEGSPEQIKTSEAVAAAYLGRSAAIVDGGAG